MANHASAKKRSRQNKSRNTVNSQYLSKFRNALNKFKSSAEAKNDEEMQKSFSNVNSIMGRGLKKGVFKKEYISRKLSSLSKQISKK
jgi:Ribosomal protein S20